MGPAPFCVMSPVVTCRRGKYHLHLAAIARCHLAILSIEHDLSQKLDLEAVAIVVSLSYIASGVSSIKSNRRPGSGSELHDMHACLTKQQLLNLLYCMKHLVKNI